MGYPPLAHKDKAYCIAQGIPFVLPDKQKLHSFSMQLLINPNRFNIWVINQVNYKF